MRFGFIDAEKRSYPLTVLCRVMQVTRGGYYAWRMRKPSARRQRDAVLLGKIRAFHEASGKSYGRPRIFDDLRAVREPVGKKRVARLSGSTASAARTGERLFPPPTASMRCRWHRTC